jgi:RNA polymerase sigma-70 factor (ECF subfamily)
MVDEARLRELALGCQQGSTTAQRALYAYCYGYGLTVALFYSGSREEAEEVLQDSFVKLFRYLLREAALPQGLLPYFRRMIINTAIDACRKQQRYGSLSLPLLPTISYNSAVEQLNQEDLYRLLQRLPPSYRLVFNLAVLEGRSHAEIGQRLGISTGTSKSNLHKARKLLQRMASPYFNLSINPSNA